MKSGYTFIGWATTQDATSIEYSPGATYSENRNVVLYAIWNKNVESVETYTVTYNLNGGEGTFASQVKISNQTLTIHKDEPTKFGYAFDGWETTDGTIYLAGAEYIENANLELVAKWSELPSAGTITFSNGYNLINSTINGSIESTATIPANSIITLRCGGNVGGNATYHSVGSGYAAFDNETFFSWGGGNSSSSTYTTTTSGTLKLTAKIQTMRNSDNVVISDNIVADGIQGYVEIISITNMQGAKYILK